MEVLEIPESATESTDSPVQTLAAYSRTQNAAIVNSGIRRSSRQSRPPPGKSLPEPPRRSYKRRVLGDSPVRNGVRVSNLHPERVNEAEKPRKKARLEPSKAVVAHAEARSSRDIARKLWFLRHRELFEPLLPGNSILFANMQKDVAAHNGNGYTPRHELDKQPSLVTGGTMKDYQLQGLSFLVWMHNNGMNCILGDEMGLGKTLQTLALFAHVKEQTTEHQEPNLVICPLSVLQSWQNEAARFTPTLATVRFHGPVTERNRLKALPGLASNRGGHIATEDALDAVFTTYEVYLSEHTWFKTRRWNYVVLDEGHKIKNGNTQIAGAVQGIGANYRLVLTGTPVQNNLLELWSLLHFLYPSVFTPASERLFSDSFNLEQGLYQLPILTRVQNLLNVIMIRRTKSVVLNGIIPPREELTVFIPLSEAQRFWTYRLLTRLDSVDMRKVFGESFHAEAGGAAVGAVSEGRAAVLKMLESQASGAQAALSVGGISGENRDTTAQANQWKKLMNLLMQLRKVCDHPYLLPNAEPEDFHIGEHIVAASSKIIAIDKILADILPKGERALIFSQWTGMLDLLEDFMALRNITYARLDGSTARPRRTLDIKLFQQDVSPYKVFLVSTRAGGLGINLTKATTVIMCDSDWNPQTDLQAIARAHRIGQTKTVKVYRLICRASVEDQMLDRIRRKLFLSVKLMGSTGGGSSATSSESEPSLGSNELVDILRKGSSALSSCDDEMNLAQFIAAPISEILDLSRKREAARDAKMKKDLSHGGGLDEGLIHDAEEEQKKLLSGVAQVRCRLFEGEVVSKASNEQIKREWEELKKRARVNRTVVVGGMEYIVQAEENLIVPPRHPIQDKKKKAPHQWENWCLYCRDGGDLHCCSSCPRVFHASCHGAPIPKIGLVCAQHTCEACLRKTAEAGGMLFRCQTCWRAFCEDCLPDGELDAIGDVLPEFLLLDYGEKSTAYYIRCHHCTAAFAENPALRKDWDDEARKTQTELTRKFGTY